MKKTLLIALTSSILFIGCSKDDDNSKSCSTCTISILQVDVNTKYCDNGDGTMTVTTDGESETVELEGTTFDQFINTLKQTGFDCK